MPSVPETFTLDDTRHLQAAEGWLELGLPLEANTELDKITPQFRAHPDVLELRWEIYAGEKKWETCVEIANAVIECAPDSVQGWIHRSFSLHEMKRTQEAFDQLLPVANKFPKVWTIPYNLACYCSRLGRFGEAQVWFKKAMAVDEKTVKQAGLEDDDLKPMWESLGGDTLK